MADAIVVVPCFNEEYRLDPHAFREFGPPGHRIRFLFVDDGSTDGTARILEGMCDAAPQRFLLMRLARNAGKGEAVRHGILDALRRDPDYVGFLDADLAIPLETLPAFCEVMDARPEIDMVFGVRLRLPGHIIEERPLRRHLRGGYNALVSVLFGICLRDIQCGAKLFRVTDTLGELFCEPFLARWVFDVEIVARFIRQCKGTSLPPAESAIFEYALPVCRNLPGSKVRLRDFLVALADVLRVWRRCR